jgi:hypothetical protein
MTVPAIECLIGVSGSSSVLTSLEPFTDKSRQKVTNNLMVSIEHLQETSNLEASQKPWEAFEHPVATVG